MSRVNFCTIVQNVAQEYDIPLYKARKLCRHVVYELLNTLDKDVAVTINGLGTMRVKVRRAYKGFNPRTGAQELRPSTRRIAFTNSKTAKKYLNGD